MPSRADLQRAFEDARTAADVDAMAEAALALAANPMFGLQTGRAPAYLYEAYTRADGLLRVRLAVALARVWAYGGEPDRAAPFAAEAVRAATATDDPRLLADALDAQLLTRWGPDDLADRARLTALLADTVAHLPDVEARLSAHLWRLTTALELLDPIAVQRQLRALDELAEAAPRARFFAAARQAMVALVVGDLAAARSYRDAAITAGAEAGEADTDAIAHELAGGIARQAGDTAALAAEAEAFTAFGTAQGVPSIAAEGAVLWLAAGAPERARASLHQLAGGGFAALPRDVDWLLTVTALTEVAAGTGAAELCREAVRLLAPYAGRGVVNAGAVAFAGVVDDYLARACAAIGADAESGKWARSAAGCYQRLGARWWLGRVESAPAPAGAAHLVPGPGGLWTVGVTGATTPVREMRGFRYLRLLLERPGVEVSALELTAAVGGEPSVPHAGLEMLDRPALAAYRRRLTELDDELAEAGDDADEARRTKLVRERDMLLDEVRAATGLGGRQRISGASAERARVAVQKAITAAVRRIEDVDPALGRLLRDCVHTGSGCRYEPDPSRPVRWVLR
jgi:hypothetical protein